MSSYQINGRVLVGETLGTVPTPTRAVVPCSPREWQQRPSMRRSSAVLSVIMVGRLLSGSWIKPLNSGDWAAAVRPLFHPTPVGRLSGEPTRLDQSERRWVVLSGTATFRLTRPMSGRSRERCPSLESATHCIDPREKFTRGMLRYKFACR